MQTTALRGRARKDVVHIWAHNLKNDSKWMWDMSAEHYGNYAWDCLERAPESAKEYIFLAGLARAHAALATNK